MSEAPERIWAWWDDTYDVGLLNEHGDKRYTPNDAKEYVRADRIEELEAQLSEARQVGKEWFEEQKKARKDANAVEAKLAKAVGAGVNVGVSLYAAISLLERGGKKAAPSDKMFNQMLVDYKASLDRLSTTLTELKGETDE